MSKSDLETFYPEGKKITIASEEFAIKPFVLRNRTKVLGILAGALTEVAKSNSNLTLTPQNMPIMITSLINIAGEKLVEVYEIVLDRPREWLEENILLKDEINIIQAITEVNDLPFLLSQVKTIIENVKSKKGN